MQLIADLTTQAGGARTGNEFILTFTTNADRTYTVQHTPTLNPAAWLDLPTLPGTGAPRTVIHTTADTLHFYRVREQ